MFKRTPKVFKRRKKASSGRMIVATEGDGHAGHVLGLMNPAVELHQEDEDGELVPYTPELTAMQAYLWKLRAEHINSIMAWADGDDVILLHGGDACEGDKYISRLVSTRRADQPIIAAWNMYPWLDHSNVKALRLYHGTAAHGFGAGSAEITIAKYLQGYAPDRDIKTIKHGLSTFAGVDFEADDQFDVAHHGPSKGIREWTYGNQMRHYTKSLQFEHITRRKRPPRYLFRYHYHDYWRERVFYRNDTEEFLTDFILVPCYCGMKEHGRQATRSKYIITNGIVAVEIVNGRVKEVRAFWKEKDTRTREAL